MVEFRWKTEGTRTAGTIVYPPPACYLLIIVGVSVLVTVTLTGKVSEQEERFQAKQIELEAAANAKHMIVCVRRRMVAGNAVRSSDIGVQQVSGAVPIDALTNTCEAIGKTIKCELPANGIICQHQLFQATSK